MGSAERDGREYPYKSDKERELAGRALRSFADSLIDAGIIETKGKDTEQVLQEARKLLLANPEMLLNTRYYTTHKSSILDAARSFATAGQVELALVMYATLFEHAINYLLVWGSTRLRGLSDDEAREIVRAASLHLKTGALYKLTMAEEFDPVTAKTVRRVAERRNAFVHYKWRSEALFDLLEPREDADRLFEEAENAAQSLEKEFRRRTAGGFMWPDGSQDVPDD